MNKPNPLPLVSHIGNRHGSRSFRTCELKCASQCDHPEPNKSGSPHIQEVLTRAVSRRAILHASVAGLAAFGASGLASAAASPNQRLGRSVRPSSLTHGAVPPNRLDNIVIPAGYVQSLIVAWGDAVVSDAPKFDVFNQTAEAQSKQFGYNNDYTMVLPLHHKSKSLLVCNHEYTDEPLMYPTGRYDENTIRRISMAAHGMSVIAIERVGRGGGWRIDKSTTKYNRRLTAESPFQVTGPAAADSRVGRHAIGTFGNCSGGVTPWGTVLSGEENFNGYFDVSGTVAAEHVASFKRYGVPTTTTTSVRRWSAVDDRFDLSKTPSEAYRMGWVVEIDPYNPQSTPKKRTMLGRLKHEGATTTLTADGRVAVYLGDDEKGEYIYKFVSAAKYDESNRKANESLLDHGTLYVGRFTGDGQADGLYDGSGEWIGLTSDTESYVAGMSVADVLINTRIAADTMQPTRLDRPEDIERNPMNGKIYAALTNNSDRGKKFPPTEASPIVKSMVRDDYQGPLKEAAGNRNGYILEMIEEGDDAAKTAFSWNLFLVCGDPSAQETYFGGYDKSMVSPISCPDNVTFDGRGNLWISTDGNALGSNDGIFSVPTAGPERGRVRQFLSVPFGSEACGPLISDDDRTVFVAVQHPGETDTATFEQPSSLWPHTNRYPRPGISCVWRKDGKPAGN